MAYQQKCIENSKVKIISRYMISSLSSELEFYTIKQHLFRSSAICLLLDTWILLTKTRSTDDRCTVGLYISHSRHMLLRGRWGNFRSRLPFRGYLETSGKKRWRDIYLIAEGSLAATSRNPRLVLGIYVSKLCISSYVNVLCPKMVLGFLVIHRDTSTELFDRFLC